MGTMIAAMRAAIAAAAAAPPPAPPAEPTTPTLIPTSPTRPPPMTQEQMFAKFRMDMHRAGLVPYEIEDAYFGRTYKGPAVNVRDVSLASRATTLTLVTHGIAANLWRVYPVMEPLSV